MRYITVEGLSFQYDAEPVLDNICLLYTSKQPLISLKVWLFQKLSVLNSTVGISVMERLLKMNHQQMCLILQRLETTLNWSK